MIRSMSLAFTPAALEAAGVKASDIDLIIVATSTPDYIFPSTACLLQAKLGIANCPAFDVQAVCSGFVYGLATADNFIRAGTAKHALVVGAEVFSRILDWNDRGTCVLFGDGAGAVVIGRSDIVGKVFASLEELECGLGPKGPILCNWSITFEESGDFLWQYSDVGQGGTYTCGGGVLNVDDPGIEVSYDPETGVLTWEGVEYMAIPTD